MTRKATNSERCGAINPSTWVRTVYSVVLVGSARGIDAVLPTMRVAGAIRRGWFLRFTAAS
eukprot:2221165-Prymnesium_polylepis.2